MVRSGGLEPPRVLPHSDLNAARLPIPPRPQVLKRERHLAADRPHLKRKITQTCETIGTDHLGST